MEGKINSGQLMVTRVLRIMFYSGLRFLLSPFYTPIALTQGQQMALTSVFLLREEKKGEERLEEKRKEKKRRGLMRNKKHETVE